MQNRIIFQQHGADDRIGGIFDRHGEYGVHFLRVDKSACNAVLQRLADFVVGVVLEFVADMVLFVGGMGDDDLVAVEDQEIPMHAAVLVLHELHERLRPLEQRRRPVG